MISPTIPQNSTAAGVPISGVGTARENGDHAKRFLGPEWFFLAVSIPFGIAFLLLTPPFQVPDENAHFLRSFQLSEGRVISIKDGDRTGDYLPSCLARFMDSFHPLRFHPEQKTSPARILEAATIRIDPSDRTFFPFSNTAIHPPLTYLPQSLGIFLARRFTSSVFVLFYVGRLLNLVAVAALTFFAIRHTPVGKWIFAVLALTPMTLFLAASLSSDAITNALSFLFFAHVLHCAFGPVQSVSRRQLALLLLFGSAVGLSKQAYFLLPGCCLLIPTSRWGTVRRSWTGFALVVAATLFSVAVWGFFVQEIYSPANTTKGIDPRRQLLFICSEPGQFLLAILRTIGQFPMYIQQCVGVLGWLDTRLPRWVIVAELVVFLVVCLSEAGSSDRLSNMQAFLLLGIAFLISQTVLVIIYLTWEPVGSGFIHVQGRYFIPIGPLVGIACLRIGVFLPTRSRIMQFVRSIAIASIPCLLLVSACELSGRYFAADDHAVDLPRNASETEREALQ